VTAAVMNGLTRRPRGGRYVGADIIVSRNCLVRSLFFTLTKLIAAEMKS
jgi:hypothetical protein